MNTHAPPVRLTERERTVLEMLAAGWPLHFIAAELYPRGDPTGELADALTSAFQKLKAENTPHAIALAIRGGHIL